MNALTALDLARVQFGFTVSFHIIFPSITIGLASYLAVLEFLWLRTGRMVYQDLYHFWVKVFAITFAMGVVSGIVMAYQFGTNWSAFADFGGAITGPLLTYEVLTAFFLEAGFLGVMLFGWRRVGPGLHFTSTVLVALGTIVSAFWILSSNSWMQTPAGHEIVDGRAIPVDWIRVIFNPSFPYRLVHMLLAAFLSTALLVGATAAWHLLRRNDTPAVRTMLSMAMWMLLIVAPVQAVVGDLHGHNTLKHQPAKIAAIEGHWENVPGEGFPIYLVGWPDMEREETLFALPVPHLGSLILTHSWDGQIPTLKDFAPEDRPNSTIVFWTFRIMVFFGVMMIVLGIWGAIARARGKLYTSPRLLHMALYMGPAGLIAILAGWYTTEIGRQPWVVYGLLRTADAVSPHGAAEVGLSLAMFVIVYLVVFGAGTAYCLHMLRKGPHAGEGTQPVEGGPGQPRTPMRPMSRAPEPLPDSTNASS